MLTVALVLACFWSTQVAEMLKDNLAFIREAFAQFEHTGALFPTSKWAARELTRPLRFRSKPMKILELGPGSGSITVRILEEMVDGDELLICEINPRLMRVLKTRLRKLAEYRKREAQIRFFCGPAQELPEDRKFDLVVCAIPFLNFELKTVKEIFGKIELLTHRDSTLTYYEHIGIRPISLICSPPKRRNRMKELNMFFKTYSKFHAIRRRPVWLNVFPISVYQVSMA